MKLSFTAHVILKNFHKYGHFKELSAYWAKQSEFLLGHTCKTIDKSLIHILHRLSSTVYGSARIEISKH